MMFASPCKNSIANLSAIIKLLCCFSACFCLLFGAQLGTSGQSRLSKPPVTHETVSTVKKPSLWRGVLLFFVLFVGIPGLLLLEHGAAPTVRSDDGTTAIQTAKQNANPPGDADGIIALLKDYGAKQ